MHSQVLHIHQDYPDGLGYSATKAVSHLIKASRVEHPHRQHFVLSIHRTANPLKVRIHPFKDGVSFVYWGIPLPGLHVFTLWLAALIARWILRHERFDIIHSHKLTTEGVIGYYLSRWRSVPSIVSIRGGSDIHNLTRFPIHRAFYGILFQHASQVLWVSPWASRSIEKWCHVQTSPLHLLPNICEIDLSTVRSHSMDHLQEPQSRFIAVINYAQYKRKGALHLIEAFKNLYQQGHTSLTLDIYGHDAPENKLMLQALVAEQKLAHVIKIHGPIGQDILREQMRRATGMVLPAINETFGMAYIEALSVNCPILYMANTGIDGFFDGCNIGVRVTSQSSEMLEQGIITLVKSKAYFNTEIVKLHQQQFLTQFTLKPIADTYEAVIKKVI